jgi:hypothetical protein
MRAFGKWLLLALLLFGASAGGYHAFLLAHPKKVLVIVDCSFPMGAVWDRVGPLLKSLEVQRYAVFALATDKGSIHGWQRTLELGRAMPYAPRNLKDLSSRLQLRELDEATEIYIITNAAPTEITGERSWNILQPSP